MTGRRVAGPLHPTSIRSTGLLAVELRWIEGPPVGALAIGDPLLIEAIARFDANAPDATPNFYVAAVEGATGSRLDLPGADSPVTASGSLDFQLMGIRARLESFRARNEPGEGRRFAVLGLALDHDRLLELAALEGWRPTLVLEASP